MSTANDVETPDMPKAWIEAGAAALRKHQEIRGPSGNQESLCSCEWTGGLIDLWESHAARVVLAAVLPLMVRRR